MQVWLSRIAAWNDKTISVEIHRHGRRIAASLESARFGGGLEAT